MNSTTGYVPDAKKESGIKVNLYVAFAILLFAGFSPVLPDVPVQLVLPLLAMANLLLALYFMKEDKLTRLRIEALEASSKGSAPAISAASSSTETASSCCDQTK